MHPWEHVQLRNVIVVRTGCECVFQFGLSLSSSVVKLCCCERKGALALDFQEEESKL